MTTRADLVQLYKEKHEQAPEKSLDWLTYGEGYAFLAGGASLDWAIEQLRKRRMVFVNASVENGYAHDHEHGTYAVYCGKRIQGLESVIAEIEQLS